MSRKIRMGSDRIEFLPPNDAAFGVAEIADFVGFEGDDDDGFDDEPPRSKWLPAIASLVVLALIGAGVIAAAPWNDDASSSPSTTTWPAGATVPGATVPGATVPGAATGLATDDRLDIGPLGFVFDDPNGFEIAGAWGRRVGARNYDDDVDWFSLWASDGATRTSGRWLAATTLRGRGNYAMTLVGGTRIEIGLGTGTMAVAEDGVVRLLFEAEDRTPFDVASFGLTLPELMTVANEIGSLPAGSIDISSLAGTVLAGTTPLFDAAVPWGGLDVFSVTGEPDAATWYSRDLPSSGIEVHVGPRSAMDDALYDFLLPPVAELDDADLDRIDLLARSRIGFRLRADPQQPGDLVASWRSTRGEVTITSYRVPVSDLISVLPTLRLAQEDEWAALVDRTQRGDFEADDEHVVAARIDIGGRGPEADGSGWDVDITSELPPVVYISSMDTGWDGTLSDVPPVPTVHRFASSTTTFVVGTAAASSPAITLRVTVDGVPPVDVPMIGVGDALVAGAHAFTEVAGYSADFLDAAGNPVTT